MSRRSSPKAHKQIGVAVISDTQGKIIIDRRQAKGEMGGLWEFPGGKIEPGETIKECIKREIKEELEIEIKVGDRLTTIIHDYTTFKVTLYVHLCQHLSGKPQPIECDEIHWVDVSSMNNYQFPQANAKIIDLLQERGINK